MKLRRRQGHYNTDVSPLQQPHANIVQLAVGAEHVRPGDVAAAVPVGETPARLLDNRLEGGQVPGVHAVLDHDLAGALGDEQEAPAIAEAALPLRPRDEIEELLIAPALDEP